MAQGHLQTQEQFVQNVGALNDIAHEQKQRDRNKHIVVHDAEGVLGKQVKNVVVQKALAGLKIGIKTKQDAHPHQCEGNRKTQKNTNNKQAQHQQSNHRVAHAAPPSL